MVILIKIGLTKGIIKRIKLNKFPMIILVFIMTNTIAFNLIDVKGADHPDIECWDSRVENSRGGYQWLSWYSDKDNENDIIYTLKEKYDQQ